MYSSFFSFSYYFGKRLW